MDILIESMTRVRTTFKNIWEEAIVRCWRQESDYGKAVAEATRKEIEAVIKESGKDVDAFTLAKKLLEMDRMNAVEVLTGGDGPVIYKDWP